MGTTHNQQPFNSNVRILPLLLMTLYLLDTTSSFFVNAASYTSTPASKIATICKGGSINVESAATTSNMGNGTTNAATYECVMSTMNEKCNNETMFLNTEDNDLNSVDDTVAVLDIQDEEFLSQDQVVKQRKLKVLFLSADTGGGHRASAESLANQFLKYYPGTEYELADLWTPTEVYPYKTLVGAYKHLSAHPRQWRLLYYISNFRWYEKLTSVHSRLTCYKKIEKQIDAHNPDIVISVHPTMNNVPERAVRNIAKKNGRYIPFFTVVTDFGSGHSTWFQGNPDMMYVASERILRLAKRRGGFKDDKLVMSGLPIRDDFAVQAELMGDRSTVKGKIYRDLMKSKLRLNQTKKTVLLMGGGEGVGSLAKITEAVRKQLKDDGVDATILVICGRNEKLKNELNNRDWDAIPELGVKKKKRMKLRQLIGKFSRNRSIQQDGASEGEKLEGNVDVVGLGFITNMAEYMVAADVLVSKAGPGTIAEAAAVGLPVMITSFLPGQEAGNVDIVLDGGFGEFSKKPNQIANIVTNWMKDEAKLDEMSQRSSEVGNPTAASDIVQDIFRQSVEKIASN